jgi:hypothetical protein
MTEFAGESLSSVRGSQKRRYSSIEMIQVAVGQKSVQPVFPGMVVERLGSR